MIAGFPNLSALGKRKFSLGHNDSGTPDKRARNDSISNVPSSPWEAKRMKIDLIAAKAQVICIWRWYSGAAAACRNSVMATVPGI